ncbi:MAG TPA: ATP cone domain-containing protein [Patescibacteria group bacterium]|jgi:Holliday junction resolvase-like predicted endonuclease|nr:ATP cone domain-containing protein [Patescibacteria group bacterium]
MVNILKANGIKEPFSEEKLRYSIERAGIPLNLRDKVLSHVQSKLYENIPSQEVYRHVTEFLQTAPHPAAAKYRLKQALMELGPTGYPFEDFVTEILKSIGYSTQTRKVLMGKCVSHEIDVIAQKDNAKIMVEAKYHNAPGIHTDVHVSLYTKARFDDLKEKYQFTQPWLFTNTKITPDALAYALCVGMGVTSWSYPQNESLRDLVERHQLYPITLLSSLSEPQKQTLLDNHIVLVGEILHSENSLDLLGLQNDKKQTIIDEAKSISG